MLVGKQVLRTVVFFFETNNRVLFKLRFVMFQKIVYIQWSDLIFWGEFQGGKGGLGNELESFNGIGWPMTRFYDRAMKFSSGIS